MVLTPEEAERLDMIWTLLYELRNKLEDLRPSGGFTESIDKKKYCKECGKLRE